MPQADWTLIGSGSYNKAFVNPGRNSVFKYPLSAALKVSNPVRCVNLWNTVNSHLTPKAVRIKVNVPVKNFFGMTKRIEAHDGWQCPYINGKRASDKEIAYALINIYNRTGRIVVDAPGDKNFLITPDNQVICVDVDMALQLDSRDQVQVGSRTRRNSLVSLHTWHELQLAFNHYFKNKERRFPKTVATIKALLFIKQSAPDIFDVSLLKGEPDATIKLLAKAYDDSQEGIDISENKAIKDFFIRLNQSVNKASEAETNQKHGFFPRIYDDNDRQAVLTIERAWREKNLA